MDNDSSSPNPPPTPPPLPPAPPVYSPRPAAGGSERPAAPKQRNGWRTVAIILLVLLAGSVFLHLAGMVSSVLLGLGGGMPASGIHLEEITLEAGPAANKIAVIPVEGVIMGGSVVSSKDMVKLIEEQLKRAANDASVKAVLLRVDSPGGEVLASDDIYRLLTKFQQKHNKPVVASMGSVAASGGYYVSAPCRWIVANELTITGSIGVIMQTYNFRSLMNKVGVKPLTFKSGRFKDMLSYSKDLDALSPQEKADLAEEEAMLGKMIGETFGRFKAVIKEGREWANGKNAAGKETGQKLNSRWTDYADGRILSGKEAMDLGLVDELGNLEVAVNRAKNLAGISEARLVSYQPPFSLGDFLGILGQSNAKGVKIDLGLDLPKLRPGLHYLATSFLP